MFSLSDRPEAGAAQRPPSPIILRPETRGLVSRIAPLDAEERAELWRGLSRRVHGVFASAKNGRPVPWATREQRDLMCLLEFDPCVLGYDARPERVSVVLDGKDRDYLPAFRVHTRRGDAVLDAFPARGADSEKRRRVVATLTEVYADRGLPYRALSGADIRLEPRFGNARWALARQAHRPSERDELLVVGALSVADCRTIAELETELPDVPDLAAAVCAMAVRRLLVLDLSAPVPRDMAVSLNAGAAR